MEQDGKMITDSAGDSPGQGDHCVMSYIGYVWNCQRQEIVEFASSDLPDHDGKIAKLEFTIGRNEVIKGIELAAGFMEKGQSVRLIVKPELAYGDVGYPQLNIPPNVHLVYDITLESFDEGLPGRRLRRRKEAWMDKNLSRRRWQKQSRCKQRDRLQLHKLINLSRTGRDVVMVTRSRVTRRLSLKGKECRLRLLRRARKVAVVAEARREKLLQSNTACIK